MQLDLLERLADLLCVTCEVGTEERAPDDRERERTHIGLHVHGLPITPLCLVVESEGDHVARVVRDPVPVEGWLDESAIAQMQAMAKGTRADRSAATTPRFLPRKAQPKKRNEINVPIP